MTDSDFIRELLECSVCLEQLDATARVLPCQHTFCKRCLEGIVETHKELRCPECRIVVATEVCDLPTNILLVRLLDGLKKNPKFVPRNAPTNQVTAPVSFVRHVTSCSRAPRPQRHNDVPPPISQTRPASDSSCPKPAACYVLPQRRSEASAHNRPRNSPRVVQPPDLAATAVLNRGLNMISGHAEGLPSSSTHFQRTLDPSPASHFPSFSFCRSNSHDYLAGVPTMAGHPLPQSSTAGRTKSLSRPSSRVSDKHSTLPPRKSVSPNNMETRPASLALSRTFHMDTAKSQTHVPITIGNPLYGYVTQHVVEGGAPAEIGKPAVLVSERNLPALELQCEVRSSGRQVQALYGCVGETVSELSFEPDAIITDVQSSGEDGWLIGNYMGRRGLLPSNYVQDLPHQD